jgi:hypothetical protein
VVGTVFCRFRVVFIRFSLTNKTLAFIESNTNPQSSNTTYARAGEANLQRKHKRQQTPLNDCPKSKNYTFDIANRLSHDKIPSTSMSLVSFENPSSQLLMIKVLPSANEPMVQW